MKNALFGIIIFLYTVLISPIRLINRFKEKSKREESNYKLLKKLVNILVKVSKLEININQMDEYDKNKAYTIISNHKSNLDAVFLIYLFDKPMIFIGKKQIGSVPFLSGWFKAIGCLFIDRDNIRESAKTIIEGIQVLKEGKSVIVFPEGKRIKDDTIGDFKDGSFKLALKSKTQVLPISIKGSNKAFSKDKNESGKIDLSIGKVINWESCGLNKTTLLSEYTRDKIVEMYKNS